MNGERYQVGQVFVAGGRPTITYNPRSELGLEESVRTYLEERHRVLSVSGPTKTGKTVLLRSALPTDTIWLSGGSINSEAEFWNTLAGELGVFTDFERSSGGGEDSNTTVSGGSDFKVLHGSVARSNRTSSSETESLRRTTLPKDAARAALRGWRTVAIDDFHYVPQSVQMQIVRSLKDLVFDGLAAIVASVPHRAYDVVRVEKEMTGRVEQLAVGFWSPKDLEQIATSGFRALNVADSDGSLIERLVSESFQSPHLMQEFCRELCKTNGVQETVDGEAFELSAPDWEPFFRKNASASAKSAFDILVRGPRQRVDRKPRHLQDGRETDIYGAVLVAIAATGPLTELTYEELRSAIRDVLVSDPPQRQEVTRVLDEMAKIARVKIEGEPVVDYDDELATLYISDPYFAYYLRWGSRDHSL